MSTPRAAVAVQETAKSIREAPPSSKPYQPFGGLLDLFYNQEPEVVVEGPAGTGKSRATLEKLHLVCQKYPGARCLMVRKTRSSLTQSGMATFELHVLPDDGGATCLWRTGDQEYRYWNGSKLVVGGMDKSSRIMSTEYDFIFVMEGTELKQGEYEELSTRARNGVTPYNQVIIDCNPSGAQHWVRKRTKDGVSDRIKTTHKDNPILWDHEKQAWTERGQAYIERLKKLTGVRFLRLFKGEWVSAEGMVFSEWDPDIHLINPFPVPKQWRRIVSIDFGFTSPFVAQFWALDEDMDMFLYKEIYLSKTLVSQHGKTIIEHIDDDEFVEAFVCDHDAEGRATLEDMGIPTTPADKQVNLGIEKVKERLWDRDLEKPRLYIMSDTVIDMDWSLEENYRPTKTSDEFESYVWSDKSAKEVPIKEDDHGMDAMRYAVMYVDTYSPTGGIWL